MPATKTTSGWRRLKYVTNGSKSWDAPSAIGSALDLALKSTDECVGEPTSVRVILVEDRGATSPPAHDERAIEPNSVESLEMTRKVQGEMPVSAGDDAVVATAGRCPS